MAFTLFLASSAAVPCHCTRQRRARRHFEIAHVSGLSTPYSLLATPCFLICLELIERQPHAEARRARLRFHAEMAAMLAHDAHGIVESQAKPFAWGLGGKERLEMCIRDRRRGTERPRIRSCGIAAAGAS